jgi:hypothetical protein
MLLPVCTANWLLQLPHHQRSCVQVLRGRPCKGPMLQSMWEAMYKAHMVMGLLLCSCTIGYISSLGVSMCCVGGGPCGTQAAASVPGSGAQRRPGASPSSQGQPGHMGSDASAYATRAAHQHTALQWCCHCTQLCNVCAPPALCMTLYGLIQSSASRDNTVRANSQDMPADGTHSSRQCALLNAVVRDPLLHDP